MNNMLHFPLSTTHKDEHHVTLIDKQKRKTANVKGMMNAAESNKSSMKKLKSARLDSRNQAANTTTTTNLASNKAM